ncbi:BnaC09g28210D [Brassica napus]|uniref:BnaC09g28210D protein n=1 Tax=Brassica napus TaxID=3708 RepID=A0A078H4Y3_BRANA|nr:BnaC09g28210D [Brassica napus]
MELEKHQEAW